MFYLDNDLKNDIVQFDLAVERFKINSDYIYKNIERIISTLSDSLYDIENFCMDNETRTSLGRRFPDLSGIFIVKMKSKYAVYLKDIKYCFCIFCTNNQNLLI